MSFDLREQTATFTAIPPGLYEKVQNFMFQFWKTFLFVTPVTCFTTSLVLWTVKAETDQV